jgi:peptidylprolyl isomerase
VGTAKRERQKANRQLRLEELAKEARKEKSMKVGLRVTLAVVAVVALVGAVYLFSGDDDASTTTSTSSTVAAGATTTVDPNAPTTTVPPKPEVSVPGANVDELKVTVLREGTGTGAVAGDTISVHYVGVLSTDGTEFDNSYDRGEPITIVLGAGQVIEGWDQGLVGAKVGSQLQLDIPADLAYGDTGQGDIPPGASITFVVDVMEIVPAATTDTATVTS